MKKWLLIILTCLPLTAINLTYGLSPRKLFTNVKEKVATWLYQQEEAIKQEVKYTSQNRIVVNNSNGNIRIKTWKQDAIVLKMVKRAYSLDDLNKINVTIDASDKESLFIKTKSPSKMVNNCAVDYELLMPQKFAARCSTGRGDIRIKRCDGTIQATTDEGTINLQDTTGTICATTNTSGSISIQHAHGAIQATATNGDINLKEIYNSASATTVSGSIALSAVDLRQNSSIRLTASGSINLQLPPHANAHLVASSEHGSIISDQVIKIEPHATKLNKHAWQELKHNVEGTIGSGKNAEIVLHAQNGSIKIVETEIVA